MNDINDVSHTEINLLCKRLLQVNNVKLLIQLIILH